MPPALSTPIDTSRIPAYFSRLPVRMHSDTAAIAAATWDAIAACAAPGTKARSQAAYRHSNPFGNPYALCYAECGVRRLAFFVRVAEMAWVDDDETEELPHGAALAEHEILRQALHGALDSGNTGTGTAVGAKQAYLRAQRDGMLALDPVGAPALLETLDRYLHEFDRSDADYRTIAEYLPYRIPNAGYLVCAHFIRWAMDIHLSAAELGAVAAFEQALGGVLALTNDYFSWRKEKLQRTDRVRNAVPLLMREFQVPEAQAALLLKGMIVDEEEKARRLRMQLESGQCSDGMKRYMEALELYAGGNCYWSATCPRYNQPQEEGCGGDL